MPLAPVDRVAVTTVVDNSVDLLRPDENVARRWSVPRARKIADLRAEHGLAHHVEVARGRDTSPHRLRLRAHRGVDDAQLPRARSGRGKDRRLRALPRPLRPLRWAARLPDGVPARHAVRAPLLRPSEPHVARWDLDV